MRVTMEGCARVRGRRVAWDETGSGQPKKKSWRDSKGRCWVAKIADTVRWQEPEARDPGHTEQRQVRGSSKEGWGESIAGAHLPAWFPSFWWWNVGATRGVRIRRCASAPGKVPPAGPPWDQVPGSPSMCSRGQRCAAGQSVPLDRWYSPYYRMRQRVSGRASDWTACPNCVALCWRRLSGNV